MATPQIVDAHTEVVYSDIDANFLTDGSGNLHRVTNEEALAQAVDTLISTFVGSRKFEPEYGTSIPDLVFEPLDEVTAILIRNELRRGLKEYEPRVSARGITVTPDYDNNVYTISLLAIVAGWERIIYERDLVSRN